MYYLKVPYYAEFYLPLHSNSNMCQGTSCFLTGNRKNSRVTWSSAAIDLKAHADALLPGLRADADVTSQSPFGKVGEHLVRRVVVPLEDLKREESRLIVLMMLFTTTTPIIVAALTHAVITLVRCDQLLGILSQ